MSLSSSSAASLPRMRMFDKIPSAEEFISEIEPLNVPAVFSGCIKNWKAFSQWNPSNGGLDYLQEKAGSSTVEAMLSQQAPVFYGDIRSHERVSLPFSTFIGYCKDNLCDRCDGEDSFLESKKHTLTESHTGQFEFPEQIYLAQVPILNIECTEKVQLECLREDVEMPPFLESKTISSINLWMNSAQSRSSTHYDPHHNLLCIVSGCKQAVVLWPPSACPFLYPRPIYGEASNHSTLDLDEPNFCAHPRAEHSDEYSQKIILHGGDALFIPEGWYHQVDSETLTIAVNFWWRSDMMSGLSDHMDSYYLRRILRRLIDKEMNQLLHLPSLVDDKIDGNQSDQPNTRVPGGVQLRQMSVLHETDQLAVSALQKLVSLVHERVNPNQPVNSTPANNLAVEGKDESNEIMKPDLFNLKDDPVALLLWTLQPLALRCVLLAMAHNFPRTLEALILLVLSPVGAEVLTRKFEEMDQLIGEEDRSQFFQIFYGVFDNQIAAMDALLNGKESFARQVRDYGEVSFTAVLSSRLKRKGMKKWSGFIFDSGWKKK
ncbi:lysine-specific demethylase JMJ31-like isoform X5 [Coffea arabica]|uniref:Lysine-specific demethylase JMJ31-like isoform X5 n=1 Tax=Coffea arabica TaxID=13443 RepID=A0ABM4X548_COFAR